MSEKASSFISSLVTFILVLLVTVVFGFGGIVLLNGFMDASTAVYTGFACLGLTLILCPILAWFLAKAFIARFNWNNVLAVIVSVLSHSCLAEGWVLLRSFLWAL